MTSSVPSRNGARQARRCSLPLDVLGTTGGDQADRTDRHAELLGDRAPDRRKHRLG